MLKTRPLDHQMDVSKLSFTQPEEPTWGSSAPRPLRRDPRLQQKREYRSNDIDSKRGYVDPYYQSYSYSARPSYPPQPYQQPYPQYPPQPYQQPYQQPYPQYPPQPYQQPYQQPYPRPAYPPQPQYDISQNPLFNQRNQVPPPSQNRNKPFSFR